MTSRELALRGFDAIEFWVGNAKQAAHYYRTLWGFTPVAYAGLETGVRDRSSFVMVQNDSRFVFTAPITPDGEIAEHVARHGDGVKDIAFAVDKAFRIKLPLERWTQEVNEGKVPAEQYFVLKNLCARIDALVAEKAAKV